MAQLVLQHQRTRVRIQPSAMTFHKELLFTGNLEKTKPKKKRPGIGYWIYLRAFPMWTLLLILPLYIIIFSPKSAEKRLKPGHQTSFLLCEFDIASPTLARTLLFEENCVYKVWHKRPPLPLRLWETQVPSRYSFPSGASAKRKLQEKRISKPWNFSLQWIWIFNGIIAFFVSIFISSAFWRALWIERVMIGPSCSYEPTIQNS